MKARPILFNTDMVKATLTGQKTQTRREVKPQPEANPDWHGGFVLKSKRINVSLGSFNERGGRMLPRDPSPCPFGQPGDLLYVRETFSVVPDDEDGGVAHVLYLADGQQYGKNTPSIHMPREFSRLTLEITDVRVERLHEMKSADARAEGCMGGHGSIPGYGYSASPVEHFVHIWDAIYSNWRSNPWVWVVEFKVHHCNVDALLRERRNKE